MDPLTIEREEVIHVKDLCKVYKLYNKPVDRFKELLLNRKNHNEFVALDCANFCVNRGETIGIIGENGAGKSTLLQLIAGTLSPDFTGKENIFFYGEILGFPKDYLNSKYNEVVDFSELDAFINRPLRTYSTGMQMRLAFSLVSSLEPDILIIDEALSVGDMHFQKKCIDRITDLRNRGITLFFCSHSTYQVGVLCDKVIWLKDGKMHMYGQAEEVIPAYEFYQLEKDREQQENKEVFSASSDHPIIIKEFDIISNLPLKRGDDLKFRLVTQCMDDRLPYNITLSIKMDNGRGVYVTGTHLSGKDPIRGGNREIIVTYPNAAIMGGVYYAHARVFDDKGLIVYHEKLVPPFPIEKDSLELGVCYLENTWEIR
jgi:ABC-type polysaccharide/polyol phosphate transport system ATPase subunit